jgi:hypothetical protein
VHRGDREESADRQTVWRTTARDLTIDCFYQALDLCPGLPMDFPSNRKTGNALLVTGAPS